MKRIKFYLATVGLVLSVGIAGLGFSGIASASPQSTVCSTLGANSDCSGTPSNGIDLNGVIKSTVNILSLVVGITAVIMIIVSGIRFTTSRGDSNGVSGARNTIIYAIVGLCIVALAQVIVKFVLSRVVH